MEHEGTRVNTEKLPRRVPTVLQRVRLRAAGSVLVGVAWGLGRLALAQEAPLDLDARVASELAPSAALADPRAGEMLPAERLERGKEIVGAIERASQSIQRELASARDDRDVVRVLCLNDKLNQVDVALRSGQDRLAALAASVEGTDPARSQHELTVLEVLNERVRVVVNESSQCIGEEAGFAGEAEVSVSIDPNLPAAETGSAPDALAVPPPPNISSPIE
jgi:hypothetical protein